MPKSTGRGSDVKQSLTPMVSLPTVPLMVPPNFAAIVANAALLSQQQLPRQFAAAAAAAAPLKQPGTNSSLVGNREVASVPSTRRQPDSRYVGVDEKLLFLAGPRLK